MKKTLCGILLSFAFLFGGMVRADAPDPDPGRFAKSIENFVAWDSKNSFPGQSILFVGSSSIRMWPTATAFPGKPIINRGFGGADISDVIHFYDKVIRPYVPNKIFLYAGDNDIGRGKTATQVFEDYKELALKVRGDFPDTELIFISIKPSKARWAKWPTMAEANQLIREHADRHKKLGYADLATPLLDDDGNPRDVFVDDGLHLNEYGYALWQGALAPHLE